MQEEKQFNDGIGYKVEGFPDSRFNGDYFPVADEQHRWNLKDAAVAAQESQEDVEVPLLYCNSFHDNQHKPQYAFGLDNSSSNSLTMKYESEKTIAEELIPLEDYKAQNGLWVDDTSREVTTCVTITKFEVPSFMMEVSQEDLIEVNQEESQGLDTQQLAEGLDSSQSQEVHRNPVHKPEAKLPEANPESAKFEDEMTRMKKEMEMMKQKMEEDRLEKEKLKRLVDQKNSQTNKALETENPYENLTHDEIVEKFLGCLGARGAIVEHPATQRYAFYYLFILTRIYV